MEFIELFVVFDIYQLLQNGKKCLAIFVVNTPVGTPLTSMNRNIYVCMYTSFNKIHDNYVCTTANNKQY